MKILVAEDDSYTRKGLLDLLSQDGYETLGASNGEEAWQLYESERPNVVCLDVMMPKLSGYDVCKKIRAVDTQTPILFISAKSEEIDTVLGLELGADDFIVKPFGVKAVLARIRAVTRRCLAQSQEPKAGDFLMDDLRIAPSELRAYRADAPPLDLSLRDTQILALLYQKRGQAISRDMLFAECWGANYLPNSRSLDQQISQLRKRIETDPASPKIIMTVHGVGYRFDPA
ncbi:MAG: DNA-binding response OmpR family regulator [Verrucomicrobiales bacterium]|jgi:DNA-binding response OmpR family regulator